MCKIPIICRRTRKEGCTFSVASYFGCGYILAVSTDMLCDSIIIKYNVNNINNIDNINIII
eukprot:COSAG05_NODE_29_length_29038_cov_1237.466985_29_plen_61_part_00